MFQKQRNLHSQLKTSVVEPTVLSPIKPHNRYSKMVRRALTFIIMGLVLLDQNMALIEAVEEKEDFRDLHQTCGKGDFQFALTCIPYDFLLAVLLSLACIQNWKWLDVFHEKKVFSQRRIYRSARSSRRHSRTSCNQQ